MHETAHGACNTVQQLLHKNSQFYFIFLLSCSFQQARAELILLQDLGSLQLHEYELQVKKIK